MKTILRIEKHHVAKWVAAVLGAGWIVGASWFAFIQTAPVTNSYASYERQLAKCRALPTSQTRYDCTSQLMLAKDNKIFNKVLVILLPPLGLLAGYLGLGTMLASQRDRKKNSAARAASQKRLAEWRGFLRDIKSGIATSQKEEIFLDNSGRPIATPPHLARRR